MFRLACYTILYGLGIFLTPVIVSAAPQQPKADEVLRTLVSGHPRLLASVADFAKLKTQIPSGDSAKIFAALQKSAEKLLTAESSKYEIPDGKRLLATSRRVLDRTLTLGLVYRLTGDKRYAARLWKELEAAAKFKDWNPSHFLDTAEMTAAFAIGYDWLYADWTTEQRTTLREAIVKLGLQQSLGLYRQGKSWTKAEHNWNQVCNGGMTLGALAIADEEKALASEILSSAIASVPRAMKEFAPDGAWGEGPGYWDYAVMYNVFMVAGLDTALGQDFGLSGIEGFSKAADFPIQITGPLGRTFNYADAGDGGAGGSHILWLATKFNRPDHAAWRLERARTKPAPLDLLWGATWMEKPPTKATPALTKYFRGPEVVTMRSAWNDPAATFVGFKAGDNQVNHGHLDLGTFVLDAAGQRWGLDLGGDDYNLPGYFGGKRWDYYRLRAEGHNTLVIGPDQLPDQEPKAQAKILRYETTNTGAWTLTDLSAAYARHAKTVQRGLRLAGTSVLVQDEIQTLQPADVWWFFHTEAKLECQKTTATLSLNGKKLTATLLSPTGATFESMPAEPLPTSPQPERQQLTHGGSQSVQKLAVHLKNAGAARIVVQFSPDQAAAPAAVVPLAQWK